MKNYYIEQKTMTQLENASIVGRTIKEPYTKISILLVIIDIE